MNQDMKRKKEAKEGALARKWRLKAKRIANQE
jgi:hypothetical protein